MPSQVYIQKAAVTKLFCNYFSYIGIYLRYGSSCDFLQLLVNVVLVDSRWDLVNFDFDSIVEVLRGWGILPKGARRVNPLTQECDVFEIEVFEDPLCE